MFLLVLLCSTRAPDLPGDICLATRTMATVRWWRHIYIDASVQGVKEEMTAGEVFGRCWRPPQLAVAFNDGSGMQWHAVV